MGAVAPVPRICGREDEIRALGEALDLVAAGGPAIVLVEGEAGIGKTRLLAQALLDARGRGMQVAAGQAEDRERTRPFGLLTAAFGCTRSSPDPRRAAIAGLLAAPAAGDQGPITVTSDPGSINQWAVLAAGGFYLPNYPTTLGIFSTGGSLNGGFYSNPEADKLIHASVTSTNPAAVKAEASYLTRQQPSLFQPNFDFIAVWKDNVSGQPAAFEALTQYGLNAELMYLTG